MQLTRKQLESFLEAPNRKMLYEPEKDAVLVIKERKIEKPRVDIVTASNGVYSFAWQEGMTGENKVMLPVVSVCSENHYAIGTIRPKRLPEKGCYLPETGKPAVTGILWPKKMVPGTLFENTFHAKKALAWTLLSLHEVFRNRYGKGILSKQESEALLKYTVIK